MIKGNSWLEILGIDVQGYTVVLLLKPIVQQLTRYGAYTRDSDEEPHVSQGIFYTIQSCFDNSIDVASH